MTHGTMWLLAVLAAPLTGAVLALVGGRRFAAGAGLATALATTSASIGLAVAVAEDGVQHLSVGGWAPPLGIALRVDGLSAVMLLMTGAVGMAVSLHAVHHFGAHARAAHQHAGEAQADGDRQWLFWPVWLLLWGALNALYLAGDIFNIYVTLELLGLAAVGLVALAGPAATAPALRYLFFALLGSMLYIVGVELLYASHLTLDLLQLRDRVRPGLTALLAAALMTVGLLVKAAVFPAHFWLPPAHGSAPAPVSAALSALVVKAAFYLLLRLWLDLFDALRGSAVPSLLGGLGAGAVLWGSVQALRQTRLKALVAYSTVVQLGYLMLVFPLAAQPLATQAVLLLAASHAVAKAAMFVCAGCILAAYGHDRIDELDGFGSHLPITAAAFGLAAISLIGLPPTGGFVGKFLLVEASVLEGAWWIVATILGGSLVAAMFLLHAMARAFVDPQGSPAPDTVPAQPQLVALSLAVLSIALSAGAGPIRALLAQGVAP